MKIKFITDYQGRETAMKQYRAGDELELDHQPAIELIALGVAQEQTEPDEQPAPPVKRTRKVKEVLDVENT